MSSLCSFFRIIVKNEQIILSLMLHILLLLSDHGIFKLLLTVTNIFMLITFIFLTHT